MTSHVGRLYSLALAVLVFFLTWTAVGARPWLRSSSPDPRVVALDAREQRIRHKSVNVQRIVAKRWEVYRAQLKIRRAAIAAQPAPSVRVVTLPPLTVTRSS